MPVTDPKSEFDVVLEQLEALRCDGAKIIGGTGDSESLDTIRTLREYVEELMEPPVSTYSVHYP